MRKTTGILLAWLALFAANASAQNRNLPPEVLSLIQAERAFARACAERGIRASFTEFFADDGIAFQPQPVKYRESVKNRPAPANPLAYMLAWEPIFGEVSAAGDLGYDAGPFSLIDNTPEKRPPQYGFFFSVWKKQQDGSWKVALDYGISTTEAYAGSREVKTAPMLHKTKQADKVDVEAERADLLRAENAFLGSAQKDGITAAFGNYLSSGARLHRDNVQPVLGREAIVQFLAAIDLVPTWAPMFADVARSGDLGYSYGSYELKTASHGDTLAEKGYYARVWKRDASGRWEIVLDTAKALSPEQP